MICLNLQLYRHLTLQHYTKEILQSTWLATYLLPGNINNYTVSMLTLQGSRALSHVHVAVFVTNQRRKFINLCDFVAFLQEDRKKKQGAGMNLHHNKNLKPYS